MRFSGSSGAQIIGSGSLVAGPSPANAESPPPASSGLPARNCMKRRRLAARANPDIMALPVAKHAVYLTMILQLSGLATWFANSRLAVQARPALDVVRPARCLLLCVGLMIGALGA